MEAATGIPKIIRPPTPRVLIVGTCESGKSLLAKSLSRALENSGLFVTVYDPTYRDGQASEWSENAFITPDAELFWPEVLNVAQSNERQAVFVDEADTLLSISHKENHWLLTRGRHFLITPYVITQRPALVAPTIRSMCNELFIFRVSKADAKLLAEDFAHDDILQATELNQGEFLHCHWHDKKKVVDRGKLF